MIRKYNVIWVFIIIGFFISVPAAFAQVFPDIHSVSPETVSAGDVLTIEGSYFSAYYEDANYDLGADLDSDGDVDLDDFLFLKQNFGTLYTLDDFVKLKQAFGSYTNGRVEFLSGSGASVLGKVISWTDNEIRCEVPEEAVSGSIKVINESGDSNTFDVTIEGLKPQEIAVQALLDYAGVDSYFYSLDSLTEDQILALNQSLYQLENSKFIVVNREVIELTDYSGSEPVKKGSVELVQEKNIFSIEVFQEGASKGKIVIADLGELSEEDLSEYSLDDYKDALSEVVKTITDDDIDIFTVAEKNVFEPVSIHKIFELSGEEELNKSDACVNESGGNIIPCNKNILFVDLGKEWFFSITRPWAIKDLERLERLGYSVDVISDESKKGEVDLTILDKLMKSNAQIIYIYGHGSSNATKDEKNPHMKEGFVFTFNCIDDSDEDKNEFRELIGSGGPYRQYFRSEPSEDDDYQFYKWGLGCGYSEVCTEYYSDYVGDYVCAKTEMKERLAVALNLKSLTFSDKAIDTGSRCRGWTNHLGNSEVDNLNAIYLATPDNKNGLQANADLKLFSNYLLGLGPDKKHYTQYPPDLKEKTVKHNVNIMSIDDYSIFEGEYSSFIAPCKTAREISEDFCSVLGPPLSSPKCARDVEVLSDSSTVSVQVPCTMLPKEIESDVHLFPYVEDIEFKQCYQNWSQYEDCGDLEDGEYLKVVFSDSLNGNPSADFTMDSVDFIQSGPFQAGYEQYGGEVLISEPNAYWYRLVDGYGDWYEVVNNWEWENAFEECEEESTDNDREACKEEARADMPAATITVNDAFAKANGIEMVGNPLASQTQECGNEAGCGYHDFSFWRYDDYFWKYNARAEGGNIHEFKANLPVKILYPEVTSAGVSTDSGQVVIKFSKEIDTTKPIDEVLSVDIPSVCAPLILPNKPYFNTDISKPHYNSSGTEIRLEPRVDLLRSDGYGLDYDNWPESHMVKIKLNGIKTPVSELELIGNPDAERKWNYDWDENGEQDYKENYPDSADAGQTFEVWIPCLPAERACLFEMVNESNEIINIVKNMTEYECEEEGGEFKENALAFGYSSYIDGTSSGLTDYYGNPLNDDTPSHASKYGKAKNSWHYETETEINGSGWEAWRCGCSEQMDGCVNTTCSVSCTKSASGSSLSDPDGLGESYVFYGSGTDQDGDDVSISDSFQETVDGERSWMTPWYTYGINTKGSDFYPAGSVSGVGGDSISASITYEGGQRGGDQSIYDPLITQCTYDLTIELTEPVCDHATQFYSASVGGCCQLNEKVEDGQCVPLVTEDMFAVCGE